MARLSYGAMDPAHGGPLIGPGLRTLELPAPGTEVLDAAVEPQGFLVAMEGGVRIHFLGWGSSAQIAHEAPGVLLIHGLAQTAWSWAPVAHRLRAVARVVAMDIRGHGLSDAPTDGYGADQLADDAIAVAEGAGLIPFEDEAIQAGRPGWRPFVVAGHGYGAALAAWTAKALGERCAGLVLVDGGWTDLPDATGMAPDEWLTAIAEPPEVLRSMAAWLADREAFDPLTWSADQERAARAEVVETAAGRVKLAIHRHALAASVEALWTYEPASVLPALEARVVALAARDDDAGRHLGALRAIAVARAAAGRPPIRAMSFPGLGHNLLRYVPDVVAAAISEAAGTDPDTDAPVSG